MLNLFLAVVDLLLQARFLSNFVFIFLTIKTILDAKRMEAVVERSTLSTTSIEPHVAIRNAVADIDIVTRYTYLAIADVIRDRSIADGAQLKMALATVQLVARARRLGLPQRFHSINNAVVVVESVALEVLGRVAAANRYVIVRRLLWMVGEEIVLDFLGTSVVDKHTRRIFMKHALPALAPAFCLPQIVGEDGANRDDAQQSHRFAAQLVAGATGKAKKSLALVAAAIRRVGNANRSTWQSALLAAIDHRAPAAGAAGAAADNTVGLLVARFGALVGAQPAAAAATGRAAAAARARAVLDVVDANHGAIGFAPQLTPLRSARRAHVLFTTTVLKSCVKFDNGVESLSLAALAEKSLPGNLVLLVFYFLILLFL